MKKINSICIIDDDTITVYGIRKLLGLAVDCNDITTFANGKLAFESILQKYNTSANAPDIIFLDINMPIMDGWQFLEKFIALPLEKKVRITIVTSSIDTLDLKTFEYYKTKTEHTLTYFKKPFRKSLMDVITKPW